MTVLNDDYSKLYLKDHRLGKVGVWYFEMFNRYCPTSIEYTYEIATGAREAYHKGYAGSGTVADRKLRLIDYLRNLKPPPVKLNSIYEKEIHA